MYTSTDSQNAIVILLLITGIECVSVANLVGLIALTALMQLVAVTVAPQS